MADDDTIIIGAGTVGAAIAYGLARLGQKVLLLDGAKSDFRAARANFGLVWGQGKGRGMPAYQRLTRQSIDLWPEFMAELYDHSGSVNVNYDRKGGLVLCLGEKAFEERRALNAQLAEQLRNSDNLDQDLATEMLDRRQLQSLMPNLRLGSEIVGASYCSSDGHANPLYLLAALHAAVRRLGGELLSEHRVETIRRNDGSFVVETEQRHFRASRVVIAAGISSGKLAKQVGLEAPIRPQRGQILVTERVQPLLPLPCSGLRQTTEGTIMIGATHEDVGEDSSTTTEASISLAAKAVRIAPDLAQLRLVRHWSGLRIMSPDGFPIYTESEEFPGAFVVTCHSGVTLAAVHAHVIAASIVRGTFSSDTGPFSHRRFHVNAAA